jgi:peptide/nickel transport system substrate-binding protein
VKGDNQTGNIAKAKAMIKEAGYAGQKGVLINPTDFASIEPLGDITYDLLQNKLGINMEMVATDWGSVVQRRASKEPVDKGGWSVFHTWFSGGFILNPVVSAPFRGANGWFGWYVNQKVEDLTKAWLKAPDLDTRKKIAAEIQDENFRQVPTITLGQFQIPTAYRTSLKDIVSCSSPLFWGVKRA